MPRLVCISDTHTHHWDIQLPLGDILIVAGDFCAEGTWREIHKFNYWLGHQPHLYKVVIAGNHDIGLDEDHEKVSYFLNNCIYLHNDSINIMGVEIFGMPYQHHFPSWGFYADEGDIARSMTYMPRGTDVLVTHVPPYKVGDTPTSDYAENTRSIDKKHVGSRAVRSAVQLIEPKVHVFGHIHECHGQYQVKGLDTLFFNVAICDRENNRPAHPPTVVEI